jgi:hypothetical protein
LRGWWGVYNASNHVDAGSASLILSLHVAA